MADDMFEPVAELPDIPDATPVQVSLSSGEEVVIVRFGQEVFALRDCCSHADFPLGEGDVVEDYVIECPLHGAQFDVRDGQALEPPAEAPVETYVVRLEGETILIRRNET